MTRMPFRASRPDELDEIAEGPEFGVDAEEVGDVVAVVLAGGRIERHQPQARHAEVVEVLDAVGHPADVARAVAVPVIERLDVRAVEDGVLPPQIARVGASHAIVAFCLGADGDSSGSTCSPNASMKPACF